MIEVLTTDTFDRWLRRLKDRQGRLRILARIDRLAHGNPADVKSVGQGVFELRLTVGPGHRIYYAQRGSRIALLLTGGDKSSQFQDIATARRLAAQWRAQEAHDEH
ncbi:MAG: type II toxin-antitoxin system RelE/ParE family toxin [Actinomycetaceae bacterium]|nr:type II toxin-antitoxin system RelE/ParE family toxin [Actinomycetaceae bacterium]MDU0970422.1 type II toxin-antitoxin system RelE/ParE family toxin [Actinomycetaceae bacterium]